MRDAQGVDTGQGVFGLHKADHGPRVQRPQCSMQACVVVQVKDSDSCVGAGRLKTSAPRLSQGWKGIPTGE